MGQLNILEITQRYYTTLISSVASGSATFILFVLTLFTFQVYWNKLSRGRNKGKHEGDGYQTATVLGTEWIPGPSHWDPTGLIGNVLQLFPAERTCNVGLKLSEQYGDIMKFTTLRQTYVLFNSGPLVQTLLKSTDIGHLTKSPELYALMKPYIVKGLFVSVGEFWKHERRLVMKSQSFTSLKSYMPMLNRQCNRFVYDLEELTKDGKPHQINALINSVFAKMMCELINGVPNDQQVDEFIDFHKNFQVWKMSCAKRMSQPWFLLNPLWKLHPFYKTTERALGEMFEFTKRRIQEHKEYRAHIKPNQSTARSVLDDLIEGGAEEEQIIDEINTLLAAGHETGATTIQFFCLCMGLNPEIQKECQKEVDEFFQGQENNNSEGVTFDALSGELKLIERCINETLRMFPPIFLLFRKLESPLKINWNGQDYVLPPNTNIGVAPMLLHRKSEYYPEPEKFDPNRFLPEECSKRHAYTFLPFSAGPRNCLGLKFAMMQMKMMAAYTIRNFSITTTDKLEDITLLPYLATTPSKDFTFQLTRRDANCYYRPT